MTGPEIIELIFERAKNRESLSLSSLACEMLAYEIKELQRLQSSQAPLTCDSCVRRETCPRRGKVCMYHDDGTEDPSQAPVGGGVPDQEWNGPLLYDLLRIDSDEPDWEGAAKRVHDWFTSRLPALKTGEVETLLRIESCVRSLRDCGPEYIGAEECRLLDRLDAIRAQATTSGETRTTTDTEEG